MIPKFRVWDKTRNKMIDTEDLLSVNFEYEEIVCQEIYQTSDGSPDRDLYDLSFRVIVLMQSTGLTDKNGVEVYEGDILYYPEQDFDQYGCIEWNQDMISFVLNNGYELFRYGDFGVGEVVGNIYENPELVEV